MRWMLALVASSFVLVASAIEPPKPAPAPAKPPAKEQPAQPAPQPATDDQPAAGGAADTSKPEDVAKTAEPAADDDEALPPLPAGTVPSGPPPQRFTPSEKVRADFPVSFPIDI